MNANATQQLKDEGSVIGYKPKLYQDKRKINSYDIKNQEEIKYNNTINSILDNLPSQPILEIEDVIASIDKAIDRLAKLFDTKDNEYNIISNFINSIGVNDNYTKEFLDSHKYNINNSQIPETIYELVNQKKRMESLSKTLKKLYYNNQNISKEEIITQDKKLQEAIQDKAKVDYGLNYVTLASDAKINKAILIYAYQVDEAVIKLEQSALVSEEPMQAVPKILKDISNSMFKEINIKLDDRINSFNYQQSIDIMDKTLYNYYINRKELNQYYDIISKHSSEGSYLLSQVEKFEDSLKHSIENVSKSLLGNTYHLNSLEELMTEKQMLRSIYSSIGYKQ